MTSEIDAVVERLEGRCAEDSRRSDGNLFKGWMVVSTADLRALLSAFKAQRAELAAIKSEAWCWHDGDPEAVYAYPLEWAEQELDPKAGPCVERFGWGGRLPETWAVFRWTDDEWDCVEYETAAAARAALAGEAVDGARPRVGDGGEG